MMPNSSAPKFRKYGAFVATLGVMNANDTAYAMMSAPSVPWQPSPHLGHNAPGAAPMVFIHEMNPDDLLDYAREERATRKVAAVKRKSPPKVHRALKEAAHANYMADYGE